MKHSLKQITNLVHEINRDLFNGILSINFPIKYGNMKAAGYVRVSYTNWEVLELRISKKYDLTDKQLYTVIAHELIHVWEMQILRQRPDHKAAFLNKMNELNTKHNLEIGVYINNLKLSEAPKSNKPVFFIMSQDGTKIAMFQNVSMLMLNRARIVRAFGENFKIGKCIQSGYQVQRNDGRIKYTYTLTPLNSHKVKILEFFYDDISKGA